MPYAFLYPLFREGAKRAKIETPIEFDGNAWGSDHVTFIKWYECLNRHSLSYTLRSKVPAVLTTNKDCTRYPCYHTIGDTLEHVDPKVATDILRMNVAVITKLALGHTDTRILAETFDPKQDDDVAHY